jgi:hypothetical protein
MASCAACNTTILFGGVREGEDRFCNTTCHGRGYLLSIARELPPSTVMEHTSAVFHGACPRCQGAGPVEVHTSYTVWSALVLTSWRSEPRMSCRRCGVKAQIGAAAFSLALGWWGFPWGLVMTPVQVTRNIVAMFKRRHVDAPSADLQRAVAMSLASQVASRASVAP